MMAMLEVMAFGFVHHVGPGGVEHQADDHGERAAGHPQNCFDHFSSPLFDQVGSQPPSRRHGSILTRAVSASLSGATSRILGNALVTWPTACFCEKSLPARS